MNKKTKAELLERRAQISAKRLEILGTLEGGTEKRSLSEEQIKELEELRNEGAIVQAQIDEKETEEARKAEEHKQEEQRENQAPIIKVTERCVENPLTMLIRGAISGNMVDGVKSIADEGRRMHNSANLGANERGVYIPMESRAILQATSSTHGQEGVATDLFNILDPIREQLVVAKAGATVLTGLTSNIDLPDYSGTTANWEQETGKAKDGAGTFRTKKLSPKRLATTINISRQLLMQDSAGTEAMLKRDIVASIYTKLESTIFGKGTGGEGAPAGLLHGVSDAGAVKDYGTLVDLATKLRKDLYSGAKIKAIVNPEGYAILSKLPIMENVVQGFLVSGGKLATGQDVLDTTALADGILMGDFSQFVLGQWGALELKVDDTTRFDEGIVRIMVNSYWDYKFRDDKAYKWATISAAKGK